MGEREESEWLKGAVRIWVEDDAPGARYTEGHEGVATAWHRIFGEDIPSESQMADYGDTCFYFSDRAIRCSAYDGDSIWVNREQFSRLPDRAIAEMSRYALAECRKAWGGVEALRRVFARFCDAASQKRRDEDQGKAEPRRPRARWGCCSVYDDLGDVVGDAYEVYDDRGNVLGRAFEVRVEGGYPRIFATWNVPFSPPVRFEVAPLGEARDMVQRGLSEWCDVEPEVSA